MGGLIGLLFHCWKNNDTYGPDLMMTGWLYSKRKITLNKKEYLKRRKEEEAKRMVSEKVQEF